MLRCAEPSGLLFCLDSLLHTTTDPAQCMYVCVYMLFLVYRRATMPTRCLCLLARMLQPLVASCMGSRWQLSGWHTVCLGESSEMALAHLLAASSSNEVLCVSSTQSCLFADRRHTLTTCVFVPAPACRLSPTPALASSSQGGQEGGSCC